MSNRTYLITYKTKEGKTESTYVRSKNLYPLKCRLESEESKIIKIEKPI